MNDFHLFRHFTVLTPDRSGGVSVLTDHHVAVSDGRIVYCGPSEESARSFLPDDAEQYDGHGKLLMPAFANAHGHIAMTLMRNTADDLNLHDWLFNAIFPREERLTDDIVRKGTLLGLCEMIRSGTGAAADMYYFSDAVVQAVLDSGMRANVCCEGKSFNPKSGKTEPDSQAFDRFFREVDQAGGGRMRAALMIHSIYLYDEPLYKPLADMAHAAGAFIQVHVSETRREVEECVSRYGMRPPAKLASLGVLDGPVIASHCVHLNDEDRAILSRPHVLVSHNPSSNMKLGSGLADVPAMLQSGIRVGLGTDGAASNNTLDLYREMRLAAFIAKALHGDASALRATDVIRMATCDGMVGLGFTDSGRIETGCQADLQVLRLDHPSLTPLGEASAAIVYCGDGARVESLMVDGQFLMYKHEIRTLDEERILAESADAASKLYS